MRLPFSCTQCSQEASVGDIIAVSPLDVVDNGLYELTCPKGHITKHVITNPKFEVLVELACTAIHDRYYREAVASFTAGLERFYEFYLAVMAVHKNVDRKLFDATWKHVKSQSERQLGAFIFTFTYQHNESPALLPNKLVQFRNNVIHKGQIPTREEATKYGNAVVNVIAPVLTLLMRDFKTDTLSCFTRDTTWPEMDSETAPVSARTISSIFGYSPGSWSGLETLDVAARVVTITEARITRKPFP